MKFTLILFYSFCSIWITGFSQSVKQEVDTTYYSYKKPDKDGTGKVYMGREIASVMSFSGKDWLERPSRPKEENTALAISNLPVTDRSTVADIGAGSGYYTFRIAEAVPEGQVYAVEIQDAAIKYLKERSLEWGHGNVEVIKGSEKSTNLPEQSVDVAIMVDVYHELLFPHEVLQDIKSSLKPDGRLILIEYREEDPKVKIKKLHKMSVDQITKELNANGFKLSHNGQFMNIQHFLIFEID
ncbi:class I SAM-dependent methyltransferase [Anditalea andensis]|uniref:Methyltransferase type 11 n=1 Tax=Anditalea andensis TaxID=1048983 RepID=A0A074LMR3_9BACT|nr:class I SAM-dependent methyltransferase [Anditalea andensis]KEO75172.1 methyltransferase type 11 [Anditalea andensis]